MNLFRQPFISVLALAVFVAVGAAAPLSGLDLSLRAETGIVAIPFHTIQFGEDGDRFDYREQGGQEILFPYSRLTAESLIADRHEVEILFQPLRFETVSRIPEDESLLIDGETFQGTPGGTPLDLGYSFDFWRAVYRYRFSDTRRWSHAAGGADGTGSAGTVRTETQQEPRYTYNNLNTVSLTLGARARLTGD